MLTIVPVYAAILALIYVALAMLVIRLRLSERVSLGAGDSPALERQIRVHGNFAEYVPFALLLLAMAEMRAAPPVWLHALGAILVAARLAHAAGLSSAVGLSALRSGGMIGTFGAIIGAAILILATYH